MKGRAKSNVTRDELGHELEIFAHEYHTQDLQLAQLRAILNETTKKIGQILDHHNKAFEADAGTLQILIRRVERLEKWIQEFSAEMENQMLKYKEKKKD